MAAITEPTLAAATKNLGHSVEIRIRDNGTGIPPEVKEKLFNPSSPPSQLAKAPDLAFPISHDIIVKQHGGSIEESIPNPASSPSFGSCCRAVLPPVQSQEDKREHAHSRGRR